MTDRPRSREFMSGQIPPRAHVPKTKTLEFESLTARYDYAEGTLHIYRGPPGPGLQFSAGEIAELRVILRSIGKEVNE